MTASGQSISGPRQNCQDGIEVFKEVESKPNSEGKRRNEFVSRSLGTNDSLVSFPPKEECTREQIVKLKITDLAAELDEGIFREWQGKAFDSGSLTLELDEK
jgi:hypothetical protein